MGKDTQHRQRGHRLAVERYVVVNAVVSVVVTQNALVVFDGSGLPQVDLRALRHIELGNVAALAGSEDPNEISLPLRTSFVFGLRTNFQRAFQ